MIKTRMFKKPALMIMSVLCVGMLAMPGRALAAEGVSEPEEIIEEVPAPEINEPEPLEQITVTWNANGGKFKKDEKTFTSVSQKYNKGEFSLDPLTGYTLEAPAEKSLVGWFTKKQAEKRSNQQLLLNR